MNRIMYIATVFTVSFAFVDKAHSNGNTINTFKKQLSPGIQVKSVTDQIGDS